MAVGRVQRPQLTQVMDGPAAAVALAVQARPVAHETVGGVVSHDGSWSASVADSGSGASTVQPSRWPWVSMWKPQEVQRP